MELYIDILSEERATAARQRPRIGVSGGWHVLVEQPSGCFRISKLMLRELECFAFHVLPIVRVSAVQSGTEPEYAGVSSRIVVSIVPEEEAKKMRAERDPWTDTGHVQGRLILLDRGNVTQLARLELEEVATLPTEPIPVARITANR